jgi:UrcA family protein
MNTTKLITLAAIATFGFTGLAHADETVPQVAIDVSKIDMSSPEGTQELNATIRRAARRVCDTDAGNGMVRTSAEQRCYQAAVARARQQVAALRDDAANIGSTVAIAQPAPAKAH